jgi:hypothetical protein
VPRTVTINGEEVTEHDLVCPECGAPMKLKPSRFGLFYGCSAWSDTGCKGSHGANKEGRPHGTPANAETKKARRAAHHVFDHLWKEGHMSRGAAYRWMQRAMDMTPEQAHIGRFSREECKRVVLAFKDAHPELWKQIRGDKA